MTQFTSVVFMGFAVFAASPAAFAQDDAYAGEWARSYASGGKRSDARLIEPKLTPKSEPERLLRALIMGEWDRDVISLARGGDADFQWLSDARTSDALRLFYNSTASTPRCQAMLTVGAYVDSQNVLHRRPLLIVFRKKADHWSPIAASALPKDVSSRLMTELLEWSSKLLLPDAVLRVLLTGAPLSDMIRHDVEQVGEVDAEQATQAPDAGGEGGDARMRLVADRTGYLSRAADALLLGERDSSLRRHTLADLRREHQDPLTVWRNITNLVLNRQETVDLSQLEAPDQSSPSHAYLANRYGYYHADASILAKLYPRDPLFSAAARGSGNGVIAGFPKPSSLVTVVGEGCFAIEGIDYAVVLAVEKDSGTADINYSRRANFFMKSGNLWVGTSDLDESLLLYLAKSVFVKFKKSKAEYNQSLRSILAEWKDDGTLWEALRVE